MLDGSIVALITPFLDNGKIDYEKVLELLEFQIQNGTKHLLVLGTTSESPTLSEVEKIELLNYIVAKNKKRLKLVVGVTSNDSRAAVLKAQNYEALGADYLLVLTPYYNRCNTEGLIKHFELIADNVSIPIILYNIPSRTGVNIEVEVMKELKKKNNIIGVKEANRSITHLLDVASICDDSFALYGGNDDLLYLFLCLNCQGFFNVYGNIDPSLMNRFWFLKNNLSLLFATHQEYYALFKMIFIETNPIPIKALMNYQGFKVGGYRLPLTEMDEDHLKQLINEYKKVSNISIVI